MTTVYQPELRTGSYYRLSVGKLDATFKVVGIENVFRGPPTSNLTLRELWPWERVALWIRSTWRSLKRLVGL